MTNVSVEQLSLCNQITVRLQWDSDDPKLVVRWTALLVLIMFTFNEKITTFKLDFVFP